MYTAGYRYDWGNKKIVQTGVLSVDVEPDHADVYLNDVKITKNLPIYFPNRAPGTYEIKFLAPGYKEWKKDVTIESRRTTYIKNIVLFKDSLPVQIDIAENMIDMNASYDGSFLAITSLEKGVYEITPFDTEKKQKDSLLRINSSIEPEVSWSPHANFLMIKTRQGGEETMQIINADNQELSKTYSFQSTIESFQWAKNSFSPSIYIKTNNEIVELNVFNQKTIKTTFSNVWFVDGEENVWIYNKEKRELVSDDRELSFKEEVEKIVDINKERVIVKIPNNIQILTLEKEEHQTLPTQHLLYNKKTKEWITWSWWELWTIYDNGSLALLNRTGEKIQHVNPLDNQGVLLLASENKLTGFNPGYYISHELLNNGSMEKIGVNTKERKIFFLGRVAQKRGLFELEY